jgi:hypothetical protein
VNHNLLAIGLLCLTPLVAQDPANPPPQPEQPPAAEPAKQPPEEGGVTPERNDGRQKELLRRFMERFTQNAPKLGPRRVLTLRSEDATGRLCSIPLIEVAPPSPNAKIVQVPVPEDGSKMPVVTGPAPPCTPPKP